MDQIPQFLGGTNDNDFLKDGGPWKYYEVVDSIEPGAKVGVRRINDPLGDIFTADDIM